MSAFFLGPALAVAGWMLAKAWGLLWPTVCISSVGAGMITVRYDTNAASGASTFRLVTGTCFVALAVVSVIVSLRKRIRRKTARVGVTGSGALPAGPGFASTAGTPAFHRLAPAGAQAARESGSDPFGKIAKLAELRDVGALTEEEFDREKTRLLAQR